MARYRETEKGLAVGLRWGRREARRMASCLPMPLLAPLVARGWDRGMVQVKGWRWDAWMVRRRQGHDETSRLHATTSQGPPNETGPGSDVEPRPTPTIRHERPPKKRRNPTLTPRGLSPMDAVLKNPVRDVQTRHQATIHREFPWQTQVRANDDARAATKKGEQTWKQCFWAWGR